MSVGVTKRVILAAVVLTIQASVWPASASGFVMDQFEAHDGLTGGDLTVELEMSETNSVAPHSRPSWWMETIVRFRVYDAKSAEWCASYTVLRGPEFETDGQSFARMFKLLTDLDDDPYDEYGPCLGLFDISWELDVEYRDTYRDARRDQFGTLKITSEDRWYSRGPATGMVMGTAVTSESAYFYSYFGVVAEQRV